MTTDKKEEKKEESKYEKLHKKSMRQLVEEVHKKPQEDTAQLEANKKEEKKEVKKDEISKMDAPSNEKREEKKESVKEETRINAEELARKTAEETAKRVAEETRKEFEKKIGDIVNKDKDILDKQKEADELVAIWDKEKRLPKDWREIASEQLRLSNANLEKRLKEREEQAKKIEEERKMQEAKTKDEQQKAYNKRLEDINTRVVSELNELYEGKFLKKPQDINKADAEDMVETNDLIKFGIELNKKRVEQQLPPIDSIAKIYFMHYKPIKDSSPSKKDNQPAGADAPVSGARVTPVRESKGNYYQSIHNRSFKQILRDALRSK